MSCPYLNRCSDENIKCGRCMLSEKQSYYVEYHEYPEEKVIVPSFDDIGDDLRSPNPSDIFEFDATSTSERVPATLTGQCYIL